MVYLYEGLVDSLSTTIGGASSLGALALQDSGHAWFSGRRCSAQKYPLQ